MKKKTIALLLVMMMVFGITVGGTIAYLQDSTKAVKNTFTVGQVKIALTEAKVDEYGVATEGRWDADDAEDGENVGNAYKLIPGHKYIKDPTITVEKGSEECYVFVKVVNGISALEAEGNTTIAMQIEKNGWAALTDVENVYYKKQAAVAANAENAVDLVVFSEFTLADKADVAQYAESEITITAYAVQADGMGDAKDAWTKAGF